jgi:uncharacterized protein YjbJ (UPF0337 family)
VAAKHGSTWLPSFLERSGPIRLSALRAIHRIVYASEPTKRLTVANLTLSLNQAHDRTYPLHPKGSLMNKDQVKGQAKNIAGKVQEATGKLVDSKSQEVKGVNLQAEGKIQKGYGDAKESVKDAREAVKDAVKAHS